jgi:hypothetical protein
MTNNNRFITQKIKVCPKGLRSFAFYILIFDFPFQPLISLPASTYVHKRHLYNCREIFTDVMSALQIGPICSNKPNFRKSKMYVTNVLTSDYDKMDTWSIRKIKPNSNPIQTQFKANQSQNKPNSNPNKPNFTSAHKRLYVDLLYLRRLNRSHKLPCHCPVSHDTIKLLQKSLLHQCQEAVEFILFSGKAR